MGTLTGVNVVPMTNIAGAQTTYDFFFKTATTGTIKTIEIIFVLNAGLILDPRNATILIERIGIGPGTISGSLDTGMTIAKLTYTVTNPLSIAAGTTIRLEVFGIIASADTYFAKITTKNTAGGIIDGPTQSRNFSIKRLVL